MAERERAGRKENRMKEVFMTGVLLALAACSEQHQETQKASSITQTAAADTSQKSAESVPPASTAEVPPVRTSSTETMRA